MKCKITRVQRLDSIMPDCTYFTDEGYLIDHPILTSCGIFEYTNPDGSIRRELRLPEHVFAENSLASYKGKPVIITHDAGVVDKDNVDGEQIGTILSFGYRDGDDVRAEIIIHNTDEMKKCGLKELSLGYNLDSIEEPGTWNGEPYDSIQTNITINHLALVANARAGEQARLNIDGSNSEPTLKGGKATMKKATKKTSATAKKSVKRLDGDLLTPEQLEAAIALYCQENGIGPVADEGEEGTTAMDAEGTVAQVQENRDRRDAEGEPEDVESAKGIITQQDEDIESLLALIKQLHSESYQGDEGEEGNSDEGDDPGAGESGNTDEGEVEENTDGGETENSDGDESGDKSINADSADQIIRQRLTICRVGDKLNMDGLEKMSIIGAKKAIVKKVLPSMRLDGKDIAYINAAYDIAVDKVKERKSTAYQKAQMCDGYTTRADSGNYGGSAADARRAMIARREGGME